MPSFTPFRTCFAAGRQRLQSRFSFTHCAIGTGTFGQGERNSETYWLHSFFSRGVSGVVSTPSRVTTAGSGPGFSFEGSSEPDFSQVAPERAKTPVITAAKALIPMERARS